MFFFKKRLEIIKFHLHENLNKTHGHTKFSGGVSEEKIFCLRHKDVDTLCKFFFLNFLSDTVMYFCILKGINFF